MSSCEDKWGLSPSISLKIAYCDVQPLKTVRWTSGVTKAPASAPAASAAVSLEQPPHLQEVDLQPISARTTGFNIPLQPDRGAPGSRCPPPVLSIQTHRYLLLITAVHYHKSCTEGNLSKVVQRWSQCRALWSPEWRFWETNHLTSALSSLFGPCLLRFDGDAEKSGPDAPYKTWLQWEDLWQRLTV